MNLKILAAAGLAVAATGATADVAITTFTYSDLDTSYFTADGESGLFTARAGANSSGDVTSLVSGAAYGALLESLTLEALIQLADQKVVVKGVQGQSAVVQKCLTPATAKYKDWASKNKDAAFVSAIDISFDSAPLPVGCAPAPTPSSACSPRSTAPLPPRHGARPSSLPRAASAASR